MYFRRRPPYRKPLAFEENLRTNLEARDLPEIHQIMTKISLFSATRSGARGSQKVAHHFSAHFCLVKTPSKPIWDNFLFRGGGGWGGVKTI